MAGAPPSRTAFTVLAAKSSDIDAKRAMDRSGLGAKLPM
jgi:hypothetical protein